MNLRDYARAKPCTIRVPGVCNFDTEKTVLAHLRMIGLSGAGIKAADLFGAWACSACHDYVDARDMGEDGYEERRLLLLDGMVRTLAWLVEHGIVVVKGEREPRPERLSKILPRRWA